jgi:hypothetical protein
MSEETDDIALEVVEFDDEIALRKYSLEAAMAMFGLGDAEGGYALDDRQRNDCLRCASLVYAWLFEGFAPDKPEGVK